MPNQIKKILVIQTAFIGDAMLTLPMVEKLYEADPDLLIDVVCNPSTTEIFSSSPFINEVLPFDKRGKHKSVSGLWSFARNIKSRNYTKIYSPHRSFRTALLVLLSDIRETFGFSNSAFKYVYKNVVEYRSDKHEVQRNLDLIGCKYSENSWKIYPKINIPDSVKDKISEYLTKNDIQNDFITISPGSVWATKRYPFDYFLDITNFLLTNRRQVVIIGGEKDVEVTSLIKAEFSDGVFDSAGCFNLIESIELIKRSSLLITNDSAPTHFGMCTNIKVLTLYCSTVPGFGFYPYNNLSRYLSFDDLYCKPCGIHGHNECPVKTFDCAKKLVPEMIIKTLKEMTF